MAEPGGLPSMGSHGVGHDWSDLAAAAAAPVLQVGSLPTELSGKSTEEGEKKTQRLCLGKLVLSRSQSEKDEVAEENKEENKQVGEQSQDNIVS